MNFRPMKDLMDRLTAWRIPGNSVSICLENKEVFRYQSGYEDLDKGVKMTDDKLFYIFSCSKVATVTAALQLYEKGLFLLDDPLYEFIPEFHTMYLYGENGERIKAQNPITMRHLFTMSAGFDYNTAAPAFDKARKLTEGRMDTLTVAKCMAEDPIGFEPGTAWSYSLCHDVLAAAVEVIAGKKFRDYVKENIFAPLGMNESFYHPEQVHERIAKLYLYKNQAETNPVKLQSMANNEQAGHVVEIDKENDGIFGPEYDSGGSGIITSVSDYSKFASALANGGVGATGERILAASTIDLLRTNQLNERLLPYLNWQQLRGYGYGLGVRTMIDRARGGSTGSIGEFGWGGAAGATILVDPDLKLSMFYTHHMKNPHEEYYQPRIRNVLYTCINS